MIKILVCIEESSVQIYTTFSSLLNEQSDETSIGNLTQMINDYVMLQSKAQQKINERLSFTVYLLQIISFYLFTYLYTVQLF